MKITLFADAFDVVGSPVSTSWPDFVAAIEAGLLEAASDKRNLPAFGAYELNGPRENASVVSFSALVFDLDALDGPEGLEAFIGRVADADVAALVYETPGSTVEAPRARLVLPLDGALSPASLRAARAAVVENLGLEPDPVTSDPMRLAFVGCLAGTPPRRLWTFDGDLTPADGWTATTPPEAPAVAGEWPSERRAPDDLVAELAEALTPAWHRGERESWWLPFCGWARGKLWTRGDVEALVEALPESDGGSHPNEHFSAPAKLDRVASLPGPGVVRDALGYDFDAVDRIVGRHPSAAPFAPAPALIAKAGLIQTQDGLEIAPGASREEIWTSLGLKIRKGGTKAEPTYFPALSHDNVARVLALLRVWNGLRHDEFAHRTLILEPPELNGFTPPSGEWTDVHTTFLQTWLDRVLGFEPGTQMVNEGIELAAHTKKYHPVRMYLHGLTWDRTPRLDGLLPTYFGTDTNDYLRAVGPKFLISMVARVMRPGCQVDTVPIFEGEQGVLKSSALRVLTGDDWFASSRIDLANKDGLQALQGKWLVEISELDSFSRHEANRVKSFVTDRVDRFRPPFGRHTKDYPRQTVFAGSTNESHYFTDPTGNRRFWPMRCGKIGLEALRRDRDQLWAEAVARFDAGEQWWLTPEQERLARVEQRERDAAADDPLLERAVEVLKKSSGQTMGEILTGMGFERKEQTRALATRIGALLQHAGATTQRPREPGARPRRYYLD